MTSRLVLLHGALASGGQLSGLAAALGGRDAALPDLDGHGARPAAPHDLDAFVATAVACCGDEAADLLGYSLGGYVALATAIAHPDRVRRVVTVATKLAWTPEVAEREARRLDPARLSERAPAFVAELDRLHPGPGWRAVVERTADFLSGLGSAAPLDLSRVVCPVLVVVGAEDALVPQEECVRAVETLARGRLLVVPDAPHAYEQLPADLLAREVAAFLA